jgi:archaellum component FlaC
MDGALNGVDAKLTDIRERVVRLEERSANNESRADKTSADIGEVKAMITEMRKDFDKELARVREMIIGMQESFNEKLSKVRADVSRIAGITGLLVSVLFFLFKKYF